MILAQDCYKPGKTKIELCIALIKHEYCKFTLGLHVNHFTKEEGNDRMRMGK